MRENEIRNRDFVYRLVTAQAELQAFVATACPGCSDDVDDIVQETTLALIRHEADYDLSRPFIPWAIGFAKNQIQLYRLRQHRERLVFDDTLLNAYAKSAIDASGTKPEPTSLIKRLRACLKRLTENQRALVFQHYLKEQPLEKVAATQKRSEIAVRVALFKTRKKLANCVNHFCPLTPQEKEEDGSLDAFEDIISQTLDTPSGQNENSIKTLLATLRAEPSRLENYAEQMQIHRLLGIFMQTERYAAHIQKLVAETKVSTRYAHLFWKIAALWLIATFGVSAAIFFAVSPPTQPKTTVPVRSVVKVTTPLPIATVSPSVTAVASAPVITTDVSAITAPISVVVTAKGTPVVNQTNETSEESNPSGEESMNNVKILAAAAVTSVLTTTAPCFGDDTLGLWLFGDDEHGQTVSTVQNAVNPATHLGTFYTDAATNAAVFSSDIPGHYLYAGLTNRTPIAVLTNSIRFFKNDPTEIKSPSGHLALDSVSTALSSNESFTVECFFKEDLSMGVSAWNRLIKGVTGDDLRTWSVTMSASFYYLEFLNDKTRGEARNSSVNVSNGWHHVALVYTASNQMVRLYVDYYDSAATAFTNTAMAAVRPLVFGSDSLNGSYQNWNGWFAAPRVTTRALNPTEFLRAYNGSDSLGFWPFTEGAAGHDAAGTPLANVSGAQFIGNGFESANENLLFSSDVPGQYLYANATADYPFCEYFQSIQFRKPDPTTLGSNSGYVKLPGLSSEMARLDAYTFELFFKADVSSGWCEWQNICNAKPECPWRITIPKNSLVLQWQGHSIDYLSCPTPTNGWHHLAVVYTASNHAARLYLDYLTDNNLTIITNQIGTSGNALCLGTDGASSTLDTWNGWLAAPRVTPRALQPDEFMKARDSAARPDTVLHWRFEDGTLGSSVTTVTNTSPSNEFYYFTTGRGSAGNAGGAAPTYTAYDNVNAQLYSGETLLGVNTRCATFTGATDTASPWIGSRLASIAGEDVWKNAINFTVECFVRMTRGAVWGRSLLMAQCNGESFGYDWLVTCESNGAWYVSAKDTNGNASQINTSSEKTLADNQWHHIAVTYSSTNRTFCFYTDYKAGTPTVLAAPLARTSYGLNLGKSENYVAFNGQIDEVRFTAAVLSTKDFLRFKNPPGSRVILR